MKKSLVRFLQVMYIFIFLLGSANIQVAFAQDLVPPATDTPAEALLTEVPPTEVSPTEVPPTEGPGGEVVPTEPPTIEATLPPEPEAPDFTETVVELADAGLTLVDENNEPVVLASEAAVEVLTVADPYFTRGGLKFRFLPLGGNCAPYALIDPPGSVCTVSATDTPIQDAILNVKNIGQPDDDTIFVEQGEYNEALVFDVDADFTGLTLMGAPGNLTTPGADPTNAPILDGTGVVSTTGITIRNEGINIKGFILRDWATAILVDAGSGAIAINIENNTITDNVIGISQTGGTGKPQLNVHYNAFTDNTTALQNATGNNFQYIEGQNNYWGCPTGPVVLGDDGHYYQVDMVAPGVGRGQDIGTTAPTGCQFLNGNPDDWNRQINTSDWSPFKINIGTILITFEKPTLTITASSHSMTYGGVVPTITPSYSGLVGGDTAPATPPTCSTTVTSTTPAGSYPGADTCTGAADPDYNIVYVAGNMTVTPAPLLITASSHTMTYGGTVPTITPSYTGLVAGDTGPDTLPTCSTTATSTSDIGPYPSTCSGAADPNYTITYAPGVVTIEPAALVITASSHTMTYGGTVPTITPSYTGLVAGDSAPATPPTCSTTATSTSDVGPYPSTCSGAADPNYTISYVAGNVQITPAPLTITASSHSINYLDPVPPITPIYSGFVAGDTVPDTHPICYTSATNTSPVGAYPTNCVDAVANNYIITYVPGTVTIGAAVLVITASSHTITYGDPVPTITASYSTGSKPATTSEPVCVTTAINFSDVGSYPTSCSGAVDPNYDITYVPGTLTINPAPLMITASSDSMDYGGIVPTITPSYSGLVAGDSAPATPPTCSTTATNTSPVGSYPSTCSGAVDGNYTISYTPGTVLVNPVPLMITASSDTMNYGGTVPTILPSYTGLVAGDTGPATPPTCSTTATNTSPVGPYPSTCSGAADANYLISYTPGVVTILPVDLLITASTHTMSYGGVVPTITPSYTGLVAGDVAPAGLPTCSTTVTNTTPAGFYDDANTCSGAVDANYNITYAPGDMTVETIRLVITASSHTFTYGSVVPTVTASYSTGPKPATMTTDPVCVTTVNSSSDVNFYPGANTCSGAVDPNYDISYVAGDMTITPATLMITASSHTMPYGGTVPTVTPSYSGLVGGDTEPETPPTCSTTATSVSPVGPYPSTCVGAADANYNIFYTSGVVTIVPVPLVITASSGSMVAGSAVPAITPSYSGFVAGDSAPAVPPVCSTTATSASPVGTYPTTCSGAVAPNYSISYVPGTMTVTAPVIPPPPLLVPVTGAAGGALIPVTGGNLIVSGIGHSCMTTAGGQVLCWGLNASGQVGNATFVNQLVPVYVEGLAGVLNLVAGSQHTCALTTDGSLWCWGDNSFGQLGNGTTTNSSVPVKVIDLPDEVLSFTAGEDFTCAQLRNNEVWCWGKNDLGQLNDGTTENQDSPVLSKLTEILSQLSGGRSLLLTSDLLGNLANWSKFEDSAVNSVSDALSISANRWGNTGCAVQADGVIKCWGADLTAAEVEDSLLALEVGTGLAFNCAINQDETVSCWGENADGQLGNGTFDDSSAAVLVKYLGMVHDIGVGANHTCVLAGFGNYAQCWGDNTYGQLGNNTTIKSNLPVMVEFPSQ